MVTTSSGPPTALAGLRVLEVASMVAAPFCGKLLASLGADVLKIEPPRTGDPSRRRGPFPQDVPHPERSGLYLYVNTGKRGITLDLEDPQGRQVFSELSKEADVVLHDLPPEPAHRLSLSTESISSPNSGLIVAAITPFGSSGPHSGFQRLRHQRVPRRWGGQPAAQRAGVGPFS